MKKISKIMAVFAATVLGLSVIGCSSGDSLIPVVPLNTEVSTTGNFKAAAASEKTLTQKDSLGGEYTFTEEEGTRAVDTSKGGTWKYVINALEKYSGVFKGDIHGDTGFKLTITTAVNAAGQKGTVTNVEFDFTIVNGTFYAYIPKVTVTVKEETPAPSNPTPTPSEPTPTPAEPTPSTPTPAEPTPSNPTPTEPTPTPTPTEPTPSNPTPTEPTPSTPTPTPTPATYTDKLFELMGKAKSDTLSAYLTKKLVASFDSEDGKTHYCFFDDGTYCVFTYWGEDKTLKIFGVDPIQKGRYSGNPTSNGRVILKQEYRGVNSDATLETYEWVKLKKYQTTNIDGTKLTYAEDSKKFYTRKYKVEEFTPPSMQTEAFKLRVRNYLYGNKLFNVFHTKTCIALFEKELKDGKGPAYLFYDDNTYASTTVDTDYRLKVDGYGTYTGDPLKDGIVTITKTHRINAATGDWTETSNPPKDCLVKEELFYENATGMGLPFYMY